MKLSFEARSTFADADDEVVSCSFEGPKGMELGLMNEDAELVRMSWGDGHDGADEDIIRLASVELWPDRVLITFDASRGQSTFPYDSAEIRYPDQDDRFLDFLDVFSRLLAADPSRLILHRPDAP